MGKRLSVQLLFVGATAALLGVSYLGEPLLGDDLTYWSFARALHENGLSAWGAESFYDLRWPVWGVCWLLQVFNIPGLFSFWGEPVIYLAAGAALIFFLSRSLTSSGGFAFAAAMTFVCHPFLDAVSSSPMPDLSEAVWGAGAMLAWWLTMHAPDARRASLGAIATGFCVFVLEANRVTGLFLVPVLVVCTALFFRGRFRWLLVAGLVALLFYFAECFFYHQLFGDWLHDLTANALNRGAKGTELENPWRLPVRYLDRFVHDPLMRAYSLCALAGIWLGWRRGHLFGRVLVIWCTLLLLEYSCALQSICPIRPLVRDAPRFLASLAVPMSLLAVFALYELWQTSRRRPFLTHIFAHRLAPIVLGASTLLFLLATTKREFFHPGFIPEVRRYLASVPDGATVFTQASMREMVRLVSPRDAARFRWLVHDEILEPNSALETEAARADEFWYLRTRSWLRATQRLNKNPEAPPPQLASYFLEPETDWTLMRAIAKYDSPELVFYRRRNAAISPRILDHDAAEWNGLVLVLPATWEREHAPSRLKALWQIPEKLRGRLVRLEMEANSDEVDAFTVRLRFFYGSRHAKKDLVLRPYLTRERGLDFFALAIPATSTACEIQLRFGEKTQRVEFSRFRAVLENGPAL